MENSNHFTLTDPQKYDEWISLRLEKTHQELEELKEFVKENPEFFKVGNAEIIIKPGMVSLGEELSRRVSD